MTEPEQSRTAQARPARASAPERAAAASHAAAGQASIAAAPSVPERPALVAASPPVRSAAFAVAPWGARAPLPAKDDHSSAAAPAGWPARSARLAGQEVAAASEAAPAAVAASAAEPAGPAPVAPEPAEPVPEPASVEVVAPVAVEPARAELAGPVPAEPAPPAVRPAAAAHSAYTRVPPYHRESTAPLAPTRAPSRHDRSHSVDHQSTGSIPAAAVPIPAQPEARAVAPSPDDPAPAGTTAGQRPAADPLEPVVAATASPESARPVPRWIPSPDAKASGPSRVRRDWNSARANPDAPAPRRRLPAPAPAPVVCRSGSTASLDAP